MSNYTSQQLARISELDAAIDSVADQGDDAFFAAVAAKDEYIDSQGIDRNRLEVTGREESNYHESAKAATHGLRNAHKRYALADQDADAGLIWSVGGVWSTSLLCMSPPLMTGPEADEFQKLHPNARIIDVLVYREAHKAYTTGYNSVLDHSKNSTHQTREAARIAGIQALVRAGFPEDALNVVKPA